jgi:hypothetical protein
VIAYLYYNHLEYDPDMALEPFQPTAADRARDADAPVCATIGTSQKDYLQDIPLTVYVSDAVAMF